MAYHQEDDPRFSRRLAPHVAALGEMLLSLAIPNPENLGHAETVRRDEVLTYLRLHHADPTLTVDRIASGLHMSRRTLHRIFQGTGVSVMERVRALRLGSARDLLATRPDLPISQIAFTTGFANPTHFYRAFHRAVGTTPGAYRDECTNAD